MTLSRGNTAIDSLGSGLSPPWRCGAACERTGEGVASSHFGGKAVARFRPPQGVKMAERITLPEPDGPCDTVQPFCLGLNDAGWLSKFLWPASVDSCG